MIDADAAVALKGVAEVIPISKVPALSRMQKTKRIGVAERQQSTIANSRLGLKQRVVHPGCRFMTVDILRDDIEIAAHNRRYSALQPNLHLLIKAIHPCQLVNELVAPDRIPIGGVDIGDTKMIDRYFEKTRMAVRLVADQSCRDYG